MPGLDRKIDPLTRDYVDAGHGEYVETQSIQPALYHQFRTERGRWWGDPDAGSDLYLVARRNLDTGAVVFGKNALRAAAQPFVDDGQARDLVIDGAGDERGRLVLFVSLTDTTTGEALEDIAPVGEV